jgi:hypothetical protein
MKGCGCKSPTESIFGLRVIRKFAICLPLLCVGCGEFQLASSIVPNIMKTSEQQQLDVLVCKDQARTESQTAADQARGVALGLGLSFLGAAIDYEQQKSDQRRIFKVCMERRGYTVVPAIDDNAAPSASSPQTPAYYQALPQPSAEENAAVIACITKAQNAPPNTYTQCMSDYYKSKR